MISLAAGPLWFLHHDEGWRLHQPAIPGQGGLHVSGMWPSTAANRAGPRQPSFEWRVPCLSKILPALPRESPGGDSSLPLPRVGDLRPGHRSGREPNARPRGRTDRIAVSRTGGTDLHSWSREAIRVGEDRTVFRRGASTVQCSMQIGLGRHCGETAGRPV